MKLAFVRGGLWFFASIIIVAFITGGNFEGASTQTILLFLGGVGFLGGGLGFFITLYDYMREERELELKSRRAAIPRRGSGIE